MIRTFAALKLRLVRNGSDQRNQAVGLALGATFGVATAALLFGVLATRGFDGAAGDPGDVAVTVSATVFFAWVLSSVFLAGVDETVDARRLVLLPLTRRELHVGLATAALVGIWPVAVGVGLLGLVVGYAPASPAAVLVVVAAAVATVVPVLASRALATALAATSRLRWLTDLATVVAVALPALGYLVPTIVSDGRGDLGPAAAVLRFTPGGAAGEVAAAAHAGDAVGAAGALALALAWTALFAWAWARSLDRLLTEPDIGAVGGARSGRPRRSGAFGCPRSSPTGAVRLRELRYLVRAPSRRTMLLAIPAMVGVVAVVQVAAVGVGGLVTAGVVLLGATAAQFGNQLGHHGRSLWLELVAADSARPVLVGRHAAWYATAAAPAVVLVPVVGVATGDWPLAALVGAGYLACLPTVVGAGALASVLAPFPVADDVRPFSNEGTGGQGCVTGLVNAALITAELVVLTPPVVGVVWAARTSAAAAALAVVGLGLYAWALRCACVALAVRRFEAHRDELVERLCLARPPG